MSVPQPLPGAVQAAMQAQSSTVVTATLEAAQAKTDLQRARERYWECKAALQKQRKIDQRELRQRGLEKGMSSTLSRLLKQYTQAKRAMEAEEARLRAAEQAHQAAFAATATTQPATDVAQLADGGPQPSPAGSAVPQPASGPVRQARLAAPAVAQPAGVLPQLRPACTTAHGAMQSAAASVQPPASASGTAAAAPAVKAETALVLPVAAVPQTRPAGPAAAAQVPPAGTAVARPAAATAAAQPTTALPQPRPAMMAAHATMPADTTPQPQQASVVAMAAAPAVKAEQPAVVKSESQIAMKTETVLAAVQPESQPATKSEPEQVVKDEPQLATATGPPHSHAAAGAPAASVQTETTAPISSTQPSASAALVAPACAAPSCSTVTQSLVLKVGVGLGCAVPSVAVPIPRAHAHAAAPAGLTDLERAQAKVAACKAALSRQRSVEQSARLQKLLRGEPVIQHDTKKMSRGIAAGLSALSEAKSKLKRAQLLHDLRSRMSEQVAMATGTAATAVVQPSQPPVADTSALKAPAGAGANPAAAPSVGCRVPAAPSRPVFSLPLGAAETGAQPTAVAAALAKTAASITAASKQAAGPLTSKQPTVDLPRAASSVRPAGGSSVAVPVHTVGAPPTPNIELPAPRASVAAAAPPTGVAVALQVSIPGRQADGDPPPRAAPQVAGAAPHLPMPAPQAAAPAPLPSQVAGAGPHAARPGSVATLQTANAQLVASAVSILTHYAPHLLAPGLQAQQVPAPQASKPALQATGAGPHVAALARSSAAPALQLAGCASMAARPGGIMNVSAAPGLGGAGLPQIAKPSARNAQCTFQDLLTAATAGRTVRVEGWKPSKPRKPMTEEAKKRLRQYNEVKREAKRQKAMQESAIARAATQSASTHIAATQSATTQSAAAVTRSAPQQP